MRTRLDRVQERKSSHKLIFSVIVGILMLIFLALWGVPSLISMSIFISNLTHRNDQPVKTSEKEIVFPPSLEPVSEATNSSPIKLKGYSDAGNTIELFVNDDLNDKTSVAASGEFTFLEINLKEGNNTIWARAKRAETYSDKSNQLAVAFLKTPPKLDLTSPENEKMVTGDKKEVVVSGSTDLGNTLMINNHIVIINADGSFYYNYPLNDGDNILKISVKDKAGNQTTEERKVKYSSS